MIDLLSYVIVFLCKILNKKHKGSVVYIKGEGKDYPNFLIYTQNVDRYKKMEELIKKGLI